MTEVEHNFEVLEELKCLRVHDTSLSRVAQEIVSVMQNPKIQHVTSFGAKAQRDT